MADQEGIRTIHRRQAQSGRVSYRDAIVLHETRQSRSTFQKLLDNATAILTFYTKPRRTVCEITQKSSRIILVRSLSLVGLFNDTLNS